MSSRQHTYKTYESIVVFWDCSTSSMTSSKSVEKSSHIALLRLKRLLNGVGCGTNNWVDSHADRAVLCAGGFDPEHTSHTYPKCLKIQR